MNENCLNIISALATWKRAPRHFAMFMLASAFQWDSLLTAANVILRNVSDERPNIQEYILRYTKAHSAANKSNWYDCNDIAFLRTMLLCHSTRQFAILQSTGSYFWIRLDRILMWKHLTKWYLLVYIKLYIICEFYIKESKRWNSFYSDS